jgi:hypothetical protein
MYFELDFEESVMTKISSLRKNKLFSTLLSNPSFGKLNLTLMTGFLQRMVIYNPLCCFFFNCMGLASDEPDGSHVTFSADEYRLIGCDLRQWNNVEKRLWKAGLDPLYVGFIATRYSCEGKLTTSKIHT